MKHILYFLIFLFQSCCAMSSHQSEEEAFRKKLQYYLSLPNIYISNYLSEEEKQQYYNTVSFGTRENIKNVWKKVEDVAEYRNILDVLQFVVRCVNNFAKTDKESTVRIFNEELNSILAKSWTNLTKLSNKEAQGSPIDIVRNGLRQSLKDKHKGKHLDLTISKQALLCHLLMAYAGSPHATSMICAALPSYTITD